LGREQVHNELLFHLEEYLCDTSQSALYHKAGGYLIAMLTIEKKKTDKIDWLKPLQKYISTQYTDQSANEHAEALNNLQSLREDCRNANDKSDAVKDIWLR
jgi:BRO1-like domain